MTPLTRRAAIYRAKHPRPPVSDDAREACRQFNYQQTIGAGETDSSPRRFVLHGDGAHVAAVLFRACGHDVEVTRE